jgi:hypothetical protein
MARLSLVDIPITVCPAKTLLMLDIYVYQVAQSF